MKARPVRFGARQIAGIAALTLGMVAVYFAIAGLLRTDGFWRSPFVMLVPFLLGFAAWAAYGFARRRLWPEAMAIAALPLLLIGGFAAATAFSA